MMSKGEPERRSHAMTMKQNDTVRGWKKGVENLESVSVRREYEDARLFYTCTCTFPRSTDRLITIPDELGRLDGLNLLLTIKTATAPAQGEGWLKALKPIDLPYFT